MTTNNINLTTDHPHFYLVGDTDSRSETIGSRRFANGD